MQLRDFLVCVMVMTPGYLNLRTRTTSSYMHVFSWGQFAPSLAVLFLNQATADESIYKRIST